VSPYVEDFMAAMSVMENSAKREFHQAVFGDLSRGRSFILGL
jgi:hypothetical protein